MNSFTTSTEPPVGTRINAFYADCSGSKLYKRIGDRWFDDVDAVKAIAENGVDWAWFAESGHVGFVVMPKRFKMWHERPVDDRALK